MMKTNKQTTATIATKRETAETAFLKEFMKKNSLQKLSLLKFLSKVSNGKKFPYEQFHLFKAKISWREVL